MKKIPEVHDLEHFWSKVEIRGLDECWEWTGSTVTGGYGRFCINYSLCLAHRVAFRIANSRQPSGLVRHTCDNRRCCNPNHLEEGTHKDNSRDTVERGRTTSKLTKEDVLAIYKDTRVIKEIAEEYGVSPSTIKCVRVGKTFSHLYTGKVSESVGSVDKKSVPIPEFNPLRFWTKVKKGNPDECWEWQAGKSYKGYGEIRIDDKLYRAHRVSFFLHHSRQPRGLVRHTCDNPACCNPHHLLEGTHRDNMRDKASRNRQTAPKGANHYKSKLTEEKVLEIRASSLTHKERAEKYGVSIRNIRAVIYRENWKHI